jgi:hypothetical protein
MSNYKCASALLAAALSIVLHGCGLYTPVKDITQDENKYEPYSAAGLYEAEIAGHVVCEVRRGLKQSRGLLHWLETGGTTVTQTITVADQSGIAPGITFIQPLQNAIFHFPTGGNVTSPQSFSFSLGITASANALRTETIQYTFPNQPLLLLPDSACQRKFTGVLIDGDLKIDRFIHDKSTIAARYRDIARQFRVGGRATNDNIFNTITEEITFVAAYGGSATPTWKLARITANTSSNLLVGERTITNDLIITLGPLLCTQPGLSQSDKAKCKEFKDKGGPVELIPSAMTQHNARVTASAIAVSVTGQSH